MKTVPFTTVSTQDQQLLQEAVARLSHSLNKLTNPSTSAIALTKTGRYIGNNVFLSNDTLACAEASALANAVASGDPDVDVVYLVVTRADTEPTIVSPCGNCRQWLHDFARLHSKPIKVICATSKLDEVMMTDSDELLPGGFKSAGLGRMVRDS